LDQCEDCLRGFYADLVGTTVCKGCESGKFSLDGANSCTDCFAFACQENLLG